ncbi:MAG: TonB-dependent receptor [Pseudomonadota bacterium]
MNINLRTASRLALVAAMGLSSSVVLAQENSVQDTGSTQDTAEPQDPVITVLATRNPSNAFDFPGQVTVIDRDIIDDFNASTLQDVFVAIPGTTFDSGPRRTGDAPNIRGLSGSGVLIFQDGARQSFISGHDGRFFIDPELVQTLEVVRGPSSALYGSGALGGVIATTTKTARDLLQEGERFGVRLTTGYQSVNDEFRVGVTGAGQSSDGVWDALANVTYRESGDIELGSGNTLPADDEIVSTLFKLTARPSDALEITGSFSSFNADSTDPSNPQGANVAGPGNELVFRDITSETAQIGLNWNPGTPAVDLNLVGYYTNNSVEEDEVSSDRIADRQVETIGFLLDNRSRFDLGEGSNLTLTYGGEYYRDEQTGIDTNTADGTRGGVPDAETEFVGLFVQAELTLDSLGPIPGEFTFIPGIRWDSFQSTSNDDTFEVDDDEFSPKVGISYKPIPELLFFGNYALGFRAPSFNEAFADGAHFVIPDLSAAPGPMGPRFVTNEFVGNPNLGAEESETFEFGVGLQLDDLISGGDRFSIKGSYYESDVDNLIGLDVNIPTGCFVASPFVPPCGSGPAFNNVSQNVNIRNAEISGVEIEFSYASDGFYARGNFSSIDGVDAGTGEFLEGVLQPDTIFLDIGQRFGDSGFRLGLRSIYGTEFDEVNDTLDTRGDYLVNDLYLVFEPESGPLKGFRVDLGVDNVADTDFEVVFAGVSQPGRNFKAAVSWSKGF